MSEGSPRARGAGGKREESLSELAAWGLFPAEQPASPSVR